MRIGLISPLYESVPPKLYGGTERVVANLCRGFAELGHDIVLFASGDSNVAASLVAASSEALRLANVKDPEQVAYHIGQLGDVIRRLDDFDVIFNHNDLFGFPLALLQQTPVISTLHGRLDRPETMRLLRKFADIPLVSISNNQRLPVLDLNWVATVYHGLPVDAFDFNHNPGTYLAFLGRISPEKRPDLAIEIARLAGVPLKIAAKVDPLDESYFQSVIAPQIDGTSVEYIGEIGEHEKSAFLGGALGMLFPIEWPEPFGIAPVESWACGTPVLARPYGSVPELHLDGVTGYIREDPAELAALVPELEHFDRARCRAYVERHFSHIRMCEDYLDVYRKLEGDVDEQDETIQPLEPYGRQRSVLHTLRRPAARYRQDSPQGQRDFYHP